MKLDNLDKAIKSGRVLPAMSFNQKVWALTAQIPKGRVTTYAAIAQKLGTRGYRAGGTPLTRTP
jgi:alkylated DNA nucleotide flippase Atl1